MPEDISSSVFTYLGVLLGVVVGMTFYFLNILSFPLTNFFLMQILAGVILLVFQIVLAVPLHKPKASSNIFWGLMIIPATYFTIEIISSVSTQQTINFQEIFNQFMSWTLIQIFVFYPFFLLSQSIWFFTGYDTQKLNEIERFGYIVNLPKSTSSSNLKETLEGRLLNRNLKNKMKILIRDQANTGSKLCFFLYNIRNDTVTKFDDDEILMDLKAQVKGLLSDWKERGIIDSFEETSEFPEFSELYSIFGRRKIKLFSIQELKAGISRFPREHPALFTLTIAVISALLSAFFTKLFA